VSQLPQSQTAVRFLDEAEVQRALQLEALLPAMERALIDFSASRVGNLGADHMRYGNFSTVIITRGRKMSSASVTA
jgi:hypothetical protein